MCSDKELLVSYLYDELDPGGRQAFETHLSSCVECQRELGELRSTRRLLTSWAPPQPDFGFRMIRGAAAPPAVPAGPTRWFRPAWGLAAAAVLVLAAAAAIANVEVRYGSDGLVVRTGWNRDRAPVSQTAQVAAASVPVLTPTTWKADVDLLDRRLRTIEAAMARAQNPALQAVSFSHMPDSEMLKRVAAMLNQSEARQQQETAQRLTEFARVIDRQRIADLAVMQRNVDTTSTAAVVRDRQMYDLYLKASLSQQK
jgi:hypothetical protein